MLHVQKSQKRDEKPAPQAKTAVEKRPLKQTPKSVGKKRPNAGIPIAPISKGLKVKGPKPKGQDLIQNRLKKKSPWFNSIIDPLHGADAKIPDETGVETGTTQIVFKDTVVANAQGVAGWRTKTLYVNSVPAPDLTSPTVEIDPGHNFDHLGPLSGLPSITWNAAGEYPGAGDLKAITSAHRVVSAALTVMPETSLADNEGEMTLFSKPFTLETSPLYTDYVNQYKSATIPLNAGKPGIVRWYPLMREDISFKSFVTTNGTQFSENLSSIKDVPFWELGFLAAGVKAGATFRVCLVVNFEFIPRFNSLNVLDSSPSPQDATEVDLVENWVQDLDVAGTTSFNAVASAPKTVEPQHGTNDDGTGFGMFFNIVKEILPFAAAMLI